MGVADRFVVLLLLLVLGAWGWGRAAVGILRRAGWETVTEVIAPPLQILLGVSLFLSVGGFVVAGGVGRIEVLVGWHLVGVLLLIVSLVGAVRRTREIRMGSAVLAVTGSAVAIGLFFISVSNAMTPSYNINDDDGAYIYLAKRLLQTGGLVDPFNQRRLTSYGGNTLYFAMFLRVSGNSSVRGFEFVFAALILALAAIRTLNRRWLIPGAVLIGVGLLLGHGTGPIVNLSPTFSVAALSLGVYQLLRNVRATSLDEQPLLYVVIGIFLAGVLALRFTFLISVMIATVIVIVSVRGRRSPIPLAITFGSTVVATGGWAIAELRSSGTPMFPLIAGNYNTSWPGGRDPFIMGWAQYTGIFRTVFNNTDVGMVALLSAATGLFLFLCTRRDSMHMLVLLAAGIGCLAQLAVFVYIFSGSDPGDIARFEGPSTLACGLLAIDTLWLCRPERGRLRSKQHAESESRHKRSRTRWRLEPTRIDISRENVGRMAVSGAMTAMLVVMASITFGFSVSSLRTWADTTRSSIHTGYEIVDRSRGFVDRYASLRPEYGRLNALVPAGAKVLAAVPFPGLLDFAKYDFATLDLAGGASPPPHMPFFRGPQAKVAYLRHLGYQYIVAVSPSAPGLYQVTSWLHNLRLNFYVYRAWTPYFLDWQSTVEDLEMHSRFPIRYAGSLALIRID